MSLLPKGRANARANCLDDTSNCSEAVQSGMTTSTGWATTVWRVVLRSSWHLAPSAGCVQNPFWTKSPFKKSLNPPKKTKSALRFFFGLLVFFLPCLWRQPDHGKILLFFPRRLPVLQKKRKEGRRKKKNVVCNLLFLQLLQKASVNYNVNFYKIAFVFSFVFTFSPSLLFLRFPSLFF